MPRITSTKATKLRTLHYDQDTRRLWVAGVEAAMLGRELDAFDYLYARAGQTVTKQELERDVWGMRPGTRSETVPVTIRKLRSKLGELAGTWLETVRGVGWRLSLPVEAASLPTFGTPFHPRTHNVTAIRALADAGWRIITLVGPGGVGKTRLVTETARAWPAEVVYLTMGAIEDVEHGTRALGEAAGLMTADAAHLETALLARGSWVVLDEAEVAYDVVRSLVFLLSATRFLVTSRRELGVPGEAIHTVKPLPEMEAVSFLRGRLAAGRWHDHVDDEMLQRAANLLDGLPLAMELAASHPDLESLLASLEKTELPLGPEGAKLEATLTASLERLTPKALELLSALSLCECPMPEPDLAEWRGAGAVRLVRELAARSLVVYQDGGWVLLRTTRVITRRLDAPWDALYTSLDRWLVAFAKHQAQQIYTAPRAASTALRSRFDDLTAAIARLDDPDVVEVVAAMSLALVVSGHNAACTAILQRGLRRVPNSHRLKVAMMLRGGVVDESVLDEAEARGTPQTQGRALRVRAFALPHTVDHDRLDQVISQLDVSAERVPLMLIRLKRRFQNDPSAADEIALLAAQHDDDALLAFDLHRTLAEMHRSLGNNHLARSSVERCVEIAETEEMAHLQQYAQLVRALMIWEEDPEACARLLLDTAAYMEQRAMPTWLHRGLAGIVRFSQGALEESEALLATLTEGDLPPSVVCRAFYQAVRLRRDDPGPLEQLESLTSLPTGLLLNGDQTPAEPDILAYLQAEARLFRARQVGREAEVISQVVEERAGDDKPVKCRLVRDLYADWRARSA